MKFMVASLGRQGLPFFQMGLVEEQVGGKEHFGSIECQLPVDDQVEE